MARILIMENDSALCEKLAIALQGQACDITECNNTEEGIKTALAKTFDLILLNSLLPTQHHTPLLERLRRNKQTPVMVLSSLNTVEKRIESFQQGADDYLPKPININEAVLRIMALLRRTGVIVNKNEKRIAIDELVLHKSTQEVWFASEGVILTPIQFRLLWILVENQHQILNKSYLYQAVLGREFSHYDRSLDMHLSRVRKKLVDMGMASDRLVTVHGKGYRFS